MTCTVAEGRSMVQAAERTNRVVQVGIQRRSSRALREAAEFVSTMPLPPLKLVRRRDGVARHQRHGPYRDGQMGSGSRTDHRYAGARARCNCDVVTGHLSTSAAPIANIALKTNCDLEWDWRREPFSNDPGANQNLQYNYRVPYKLA